MYVRLYTTIMRGMLLQRHRDFQYNTQAFTSKLLCKYSNVKI